MIFLIDHNFKGHARILLGSIASQGWLDFVPIRFMMFEDVGLSIDSNDRVVWRLAQERKMIQITENAVWIVFKCFSTLGNAIAFNN